jgi:pseudaminic acid cytidylyltransferase
MSKTSSNLKPICIIPARSGSKRIKNKNIINFNGKPLIYYSIETAIKSKLFSKVIVSTDSEKIKKISEKYGASVPFLRNKKISDDKTPTYDVLKNTIKNLNSYSTKYHCMLYPTAPLINPLILRKAFKKLTLSKANGIISVAKYNNHPLRSLIIENNYLIFKWKKYKSKMSQDLENLYHDCGNFYFFKTSKIFLKKNSYPDKLIPYFLKNYETVDIDTHEDLILANKLFNGL